MSVRVIPYTVGLFSLLRELRYTISRMAQESLAANYVPVFQALRDDWKLVLADEIRILEEVSDAQAAVDQADAGLDRFAARVSRIVDENAQGKTRKQLRTNLFMGHPLSRFRRPVLGKQLPAMDAWPDALAKSGVPALVGLAPEAVPLLAAAHSADELRTKAKQNNRQFRDLGTRKQFIDKVNAKRKEVHGALAKLPFEEPMVPADFASNFFYAAAPADEEETMADVKAAITELESALGTRRQQLAALQAEVAAEAAADAERKAKEQSLAALQAEREELDKRIAAKAAELGK
jgi:hypothetical protein